MSQSTRRVLKIVAGNVSNKFHSRSRLLTEELRTGFSSFIARQVTVWKQILLDKSYWLDFPPFSEKRKQCVGSLLAGDNKMPKLKGVEATKSHKKIRRKRSTATTVKGKSKLGNKGKKVIHACNFLHTFWFARASRFTYFLGLLRVWGGTK